MNHQDASIPEPVNSPGPLVQAINLLTAPTAVFQVLRTTPTWIFPLTVVLSGVILVTGWYFAVLDYDWYVDDTLSRIPQLDGAELEETRDAMLSFSQRNLLILGIVGSAVSLLLIYLAQAGYLSLVSSLRGDTFRFRQWFSLAAWTSLPNLFTSLSMAVTLLLHPGGQLSNYDLNALSLYTLGMQFTNQSLNQILSTLNLPMFWNLALLVMGYRQWLQVSLPKAAVTVLAPYLLIYGIWAYFALS